MLNDVSFESKKILQPWLIRFPFENIPHNLSSFVIQHKSHFPQQGFVDSFLVQLFTCDLKT